jgi:hypothetical protein
MKFWIIGYWLFIKRWVTCINAGLVIYLGLYPVPVRHPQTFHGESILAQICRINKRLNNKIQVPTNEVRKYTILDSITAIPHEHH